MLIYRKTGKGEWVVLAPATELTQPGTVVVHKKSGETDERTVVRISRPFEVNGVPHVYGYLADMDRPRSMRTLSSGRAWCECTEQGCCWPRCECDPLCVCRGGQVWDCMG